jgi:hypothetical protein
MEEYCHVVYNAIRRFGGTYRLHLHGRISRTRYQRLVSCFHAGISLGLFDPEDGGDVLSKRRLTSGGLHGVITQMIVLFINRRGPVNNV